MVSLLPGAGSGLRLAKHGDGFLVTLGGSKMGSVADRMDAVRARFGDRFAEAQLDSFIRSKQKLPESVELLVLRSVDIDAHLENTPTGSLATLNLIHQSLKS